MTKMKKSSPTRNREKNSQGLQLKDVRPLTTSQGEVFEEWARGQHLILVGSPGTGKTFLGMSVALREVQEGRVSRIVVIRSAVPTRSLGYLPGNLREKAEVYEEPFQEACNDLYGRGDAYEILKSKGIVEFRTTSYLRGLNLRDCVVVFDEIANATRHEIDTVFTRIAGNTRIICCGDGSQSDLLKHDMEFLLDVTERMGSFTVIEFGIEGVVRGAFVKEYLRAKEDLEESP